MAVLIVLVEARRIELLSENPSI